MSDITYTVTTDGFLVIPADKQRYHNLVAQVNGKWSVQENGWVIKDKMKLDMFKKLVSIAFPEPIKQDPEDVIETELISEKIRKSDISRRYRRATSPGYSSDSSIDKTEEINKLLIEDSTNELFLSSSSDSESDSDSDSSEDFPKRSPHRKNIASDVVLDKMNAVHNKMYQKKISKKK